MRIMLRSFILALCVPATAGAVARTDELVCSVADGGRFILRSKYDWFALPVPVGPSSRESKRGPWLASYRGPGGAAVELPIRIDYRSQTAQSLEEACAYFGLKDGVALAPFSFLRTDGQWSSADAFPVARLDVTTDGMVGGATAQQALASAGIRSVPFNFGLISRVGERLVFEKPLHRGDGYMFTVPVDAVYQAWSGDGGRTWSSGVVTGDAKIFELGRGWVEQSFRARPVSLNGRPVR